MRTFTPTPLRPKCVMLSSSIRLYSTPMDWCFEQIGVDSIYMIWSLFVYVALSMRVFIISLCFYIFCVAIALFA